MIALIPVVHLTGWSVQKIGRHKIDGEKVYAKFIKKE